MTRLTRYLPIRTTKSKCGNFKTCKKCGQVHGLLFSAVMFGVWYQCTNPILDADCSCHRLPDFSARTEDRQQIFRKLEHVKEGIDEYIAANPPVPKKPLATWVKERIDKILFKLHPDQLRFYLPVQATTSKCGNVKTCKKCNQDYTLMYSHLTRALWWHQCFAPIMDEGCSCHRIIPESNRSAVTQNVFQNMEYLREASIAYKKKITEENQ